MKQNQNKENALVRRAKMKSILRWMLFRSVSIVIMTMGIATIWNDNYNVIQKVVSVVIGIVCAIAFARMTPISDILDNVLMDVRIEELTRRK